MKGSVEIIVASIAVTGVIFTAINQTFSIWLRNYLENKKKSTLKDRMVISLETDKICSGLLHEIHADRIFLGKFHNGGSFKTGLRMDKFTVYGEDYSSRAKNGVKRMYNACTLTIAPYMFHKLLVDNHYYKPDVSKMIDKDFKNDLTERGCKSFFLFLIKNLKGIPVAFIAIEFMDRTELTEVQKAVGWKYHNKFLQVLTNESKL